MKNIFSKEIIKYRTGEMFGCLKPGIIINAILLMSGENGGLVYHPYTRGECPSIEIYGFTDIFGQRNHCCQAEEIWRIRCLKKI